jgi:hypothetical protein
MSSAKYSMTSSKGWRTSIDSSKLPTMRAGIVNNENWQN